MKYQTFNNSCFWASLANLLEDFGIDVEDRDIITNSVVHRLFRYDERYQDYDAGPFLQEIRYVNACLDKYNVSFKEIVHTSKEDAVQFLNGRKRIVMPLKVNGRSGHACIFEGIKDGRYYFKNMKHKNSSEKDFIFTKNELLMHLKESYLHTGWLVKESNQTVLNSKIELENTINDLRKFKNEIIEICSINLSRKELDKYKDSHFKALFLDYFSMLEITDNPLKKELESIRVDYMKTFKHEHIKIYEFVNMDNLKLIIDKLISMTENYL